MRTEQSLLDAYTDLAAAAPSTDELLRSLPRTTRRPATRWYGLGVAAAVAVLATGATVLVHDVATHHPTRPAAPTDPSTATSSQVSTAKPTELGAPAPLQPVPTRSTPSSSASPAPAALRFRFAITRNATWSASLNQIVSTNEQTAMVELTADASVSGTVSVRPDGDFAELKPGTGEPVAIGRRTGYLFGQQASGSATSRLTWPYSDHGWASITVDFKRALTAADRADLITLAEHVTPTPESLPRAPFRLGYLPTGLTAASYLAVGSGVLVTFTDAAGPALEVAFEPEQAHGCPGEAAAGRYESSLVLAGHTGCRTSVESPDGPPVELSLDIPGGDLVVRVETAPADHTATYSEKELTRILAEAVPVGRFDDPGSWADLTL